MTIILKTQRCAILILSHACSRDAVCNSVRAVSVGVLLTDPEGRTPPFRRLPCIFLLSFHFAQLKCSCDLYWECETTTFEGDIGRLTMRALL